jgi:hypothetical protein
VWSRNNKSRLKALKRRKPDLDPDSNKPTIKRYCWVKGRGSSSTVECLPVCLASANVRTITTTTKKKKKIFLRQNSEHGVGIR